MAFYRGLDARRAALLTDLRSTGTVAPTPGRLAGTSLPPIDGSLLNRPIAPPRWWPGSGVYGFGTTGYVQAGIFADDQNIVPQGQYPVSGEITDVPGGGPGNVMFSGILGVGPGAVDPSQYNPAIAYYWLRTWQLLVPFPPPTMLSYLTYRFEMGAFVSLFNGGIGQLMAFVSLGETADLTQGETIPVTVDGGWPLNYDLSQPSAAYNGSYGFVQGQVTVQGTFEVGAGNVPGVVIEVGVAVGLPMQSEVDLYFAGAGYSDLGVSAVDQPGAGRIEYSYAPVPVFE